MSQPIRWGDPAPATQREDRPGPLPSAQCSLCGIALPTGLMVPDGGQACADIRWYCKDAKSCTERWTARLPRTANVAPTPGGAPAGGGEPGSDQAPGPVPAELLGGAPEEALSADP